MFGSSGVSSSWANPQQNQQQQQQPSAFGQPSGFGASTFGSGGAFGQPQQQQQPAPQVNPMFGNLGGTPAQNTTNPAFGTFGQPNTASNGNALFGQPKPASGFGAFGGGTTAFGGTGGGAFGTNNAAGTSSSNTSLFGAQPANSGNTFGASSLFGGNKPATGFGAPTTGALDNVPPVTTGSSNPPYSAFSEKDTGTSSTMLQYQSITCMPQYRGSSFEELRWQDYQQGRKTAGAFGQTSFGTPAPAQPTTGLFGQPAQNPPATTNPMFGNFGQNAAGPSTGPGTANGSAFGAFGQPNNAAQGAAGGGLFGGGAFGQQQQPQPQQQPQNAFGAFGQPAQPQQNAGGGLFGGGGGAFGNAQQQKPAFGSTFGGGGAFGGGGTFGQPNQPQQQQQGATGGTFGQPQQQGGGGGAFGSFGQNNVLKPSIFGTPQQAQQPSAFGTGAFGQPQTQPGQQQQQGTQPTGGLFAGGGIFGQPNAQQQPNQQPQQSNGLFGNPPAQQTTGLFGNGGGLFGNNNNNNQQQQQQQQQQQPGQQNPFGIFGGAKPAAPATQPNGSLFGGGFGQPAANNAGNNASTSIFGTPLGQQPNNQQQTNAFGNPGLFGKAAVPPLGATQSNGQQAGGLGGSLFGGNLGVSNNAFNASAAAPGAQGTLTASIAQPIGANLPIFSMLPPGPRAVLLDQPKKKASYFADVPTRSPVPRLQLSYADKGTKLRGFSSTAGASTVGGNLFASSKPNALSLTKNPNGKSTMGTEIFLSGGAISPSLGSGSRHSIKKLVLDKKVDASDLFAKSVAQGGKVTFSPALSVAAREKEATSALALQSGSPRVPDSPTPASRAQPRTPNRFTAQSTHDGLSDTPGRAGGTESELQEGDYWMKPDLSTLKKTGHEELVALSGLIVGRVGFGQIKFLEPVDLTNVPRLSGLLGELVRFEEGECSVYPDSDDAEKPPPGTGLNVRARIELIRCWALDKATREPIKDEKNAMAIRHFKRLKNMKHTHFEGFDIQEGKWTFTVDHF
ncbi:nucleoporin autopeptidase-domain-containing protein [Amylocystis lapponica]|nr:nucleoporin autopeptidase-domain-containing protein [Amylocystis lapponica]